MTIKSNVSASPRAEQLKYVSQDQYRVVNRILRSGAKLLYIHGGSSSGKTYGAGRAAAMAAVENPGIFVRIFKSDLSKTKDLFIPPIYEYLNLVYGKESSAIKNNTSFVYNANDHAFYLANGSIIHLHVIVPGTHWNDGRNRHHGIGGNLFIFDEISELTFSWCVEYFFESNRLRRAPNQKKDLKNKLVYLENQSPLFWGYKMFTEKVHPTNLTPLSQIIRDSKKGTTYADIIEEIRCETWNNNLITDDELELMKSSGNAARFYYSDGRGVKDHNQIYQYALEEFKMRYNFFYGMDFGTKAHSTIVQVGFGGDYDVNVRQLWYEQGALHGDTMDKVQQIVAHHNKILAAIRATLGYGWDRYLNDYHLRPLIIIDSARSDMRLEILKKFGNFVTVRLSDKWAEKKIGVERVKKLNIKICPKSKNFINEIQNYRYKVNSVDNSQVIPDGNDDLLDAYKYVATEILKEIEIKPLNLRLDLMRAAFWAKFKNIPINDIPF